MVVSLSYDFSTFLLMENSCAIIYGKSSMFDSVREPYVFTIVFLSYPMYSHDFSRFSPGIKFREAPIYCIVGDEELDLVHFSKGAMW
jgi:hypothetical protein